LVYPKNFENGECDKETSQNFDLDRVTIVQEQGASEDKKDAVELTPQIVSMLF
jgi:hypothetical protein